jgi:CheY-specific phosphatase CheX
VSGEKQVLLVDRAGGTLSEVMSELDQLGFRVIWVPTPAAALEFVGTHPLSLIVVSDALTQESGPEFLTRLKERVGGVRIVWGVQPKGAAAAPGAPAPEGRVRESMRVEDLRSMASRLLTDHFYPQRVADAIKTAALEVLRTLGPFMIIGDAFLIGNQSVLSDLSAVIPFNGDVAGHLMVSMRTEHARDLYLCHLPNAKSPRIDRMEDLVGELCNQILGRINAFFAEYSITIHHTTPIFIRSAGSTMRYRGRQPSFGVELAMGATRVALEYYLEDIIDGAKLSRGANAEVLDLDEIRYF